MKHRNRAVCEGEGKCSHDGLGVGRPPRTEPSPRVCMSIHPEGKSCSDLGSSACPQRPCRPVGSSVGGLLTPALTRTTDPNYFYSWLNDQGGAVQLETRVESA